ncbi:MAG: polyprenyl synthetase family protein [Pseudobdellovibrionaceae bacterium]
MSADPSRFKFDSDWNDYFQNLVSSSAYDYLEINLKKPVLAGLMTSSKKIRSTLVKLGANIFENCPDEKLIPLEMALEFLHNGSLMIDDIQDESSVRRGKEPVYKKFGTHHAINSANFLYFWSYSSVLKMDLPPENQVRLMNLFSDTMLQAHAGQCLDLSVKATEVDLQQAQDLALATIRLKTGTLTSLAILSGFEMNAHSKESVESLQRTKIDLAQFGNEIGIFLQMCDDFGNLFSDQDPEKKYEDLRNNRVSFPISVFLSFAKKTEMIEFRSAVSSGRLKEAADLVKASSAMALVENQINQKLQFLLLFIKERFPRARNQIEMEDLCGKIFESYFEKEKLHGNEKPS